MVKMCDNQVYVVMAVVLVAVVVAALVEASVVESRLVAAVDEFRDASQSMGSLSAAVMWLIDVTVKSVVGRWLGLR